MYIIRTWPDRIPPNRHYVVDSIERVVLHNYDMHFLGELDDDVILLEWDIVVAQHDLINFINHCRAATNDIHVAPYVLYPEFFDEIQTPVWAHRHMTTPIPLHLDWVEYGDTVCDIFSTGMIYLPRQVANELVQSDELITWHHNITDSKLAFWYYYTYNKPVPIHWDVRPIHLHYDQEKIYEYAPGVRRIADRGTDASIQGISRRPSTVIGRTPKLPTG